MAHTYGSIRVSSINQNESRQRLALAGQAIADRHIYMDKVSGKNLQRPQSQTMRRRLKPGDLLCITNIDRLGRPPVQGPRTWRASFGYGRKK